MSMQRIENDITPLRVLSHIIHGGGLDRAPAVDESNPVGLDAALIAPCREVRNQAGAPIDHRAENVEHERLDLRKIGHKASPFLLFSFRAPRQRRTKVRNCAPKNSSRYRRAWRNGFRTAAN